MVLVVSMSSDDLYISMKFHENEVFKSKTYFNYQYLTYR